MKTLHKETMLITRTTTPTTESKRDYSQLTSIMYRLLFGAGAWRWGCNLHSHIHTDNLQVLRTQNCADCGKELGVPRGTHTVGGGDMQSQHTWAPAKTFWL